MGAGGIGQGREAGGHRLTLTSSWASHPTPPPPPPTPPRPHPHPLLTHPARHPFYTALDPLDQAHRRLRLDAAADPDRRLHPVPGGGVLVHGRRLLVLLRHLCRRRQQPRLVAALRARPRGHVRVHPRHPLVRSTSGAGGRKRAGGAGGKGRVRRAGALTHRSWTVGDTATAPRSGRRTRRS